MQSEICFRYDELASCFVQSEICFIVVQRMQSEICFIVVQCNEDLERGCKKCRTSKNRKKNGGRGPTTRSILTTSNKKLLGAPGRTTRSILTTSNKKQ